MRDMDEWEHGTYSRREYHALKEELLANGKTEEDLRLNFMGDYDTWVAHQTLVAFVGGPDHHNWHRHETE